MSHRGAAILLLVMTCRWPGTWRSPGRRSTLVFTGPQGRILRRGNFRRDSGPDGAFGPARSGPCAQTGPCRGSASRRPGNAPIPSGPAGHGQPDGHEFAGVVSPRSRGTGTRFRAHEIASTLMPIARILFEGRHYPWRHASAGFTLGTRSLSRPGAIRHRRPPVRAGRRGITCSMTGRRLRAEVPRPRGDR